MITADGTKKYYSMRLGFKVKNNEAEYKVMLARVTIAKTSGANEVEMKADSQVMVGQVAREYLIRGER